MDVHSMMFVGFGFLMTFLKKYGFSSISFNFLVAAYVLEWAILVRGWLHMKAEDGVFELSLTKLVFSSLFFIPNHSSPWYLQTGFFFRLLYADFCSAAILISMGAVLGKTSLTQLVLMATFEVVLQNINEYIGVELLGVTIWPWILLLARTLRSLFFVFVLIGFGHWRFDICPRVWSLLWHGCCQGSQHQRGRKLKRKLKLLFRFVLNDRNSLPLALLGKRWESLHFYRFRPHMASHK